MNSKLNALARREAEKDYEDLTFLIGKHAEEVFEMRGDLDGELKRVFVAKFARRNRGPSGRGKVEN